MSKKKSLIDDYFDYQIEYEKKYGVDVIVLIEIGSFYEVYGVDNESEKLGKAKEVSNILNIQLTRKDKSILDNSRKNPLLCGVPTVSYERYLDILLKLNRFTIVLVEQITPLPKVTRKVTKVISPGTQINSLNEDNSYLISLCVQEEKSKIYTVGCSYIDISTGKNSVLEVYGTLDDKQFSLDAILKLIKAINPKEILINTLDVIELSNEEIINYFEIHNIPYHIFNDKIPSIMKNVNYQNEVLKAIFDEQSFLTPIESLHLERVPTGTLSYILMLKFVSEHDKNIIKNIDKPKRDIYDFYLYLGASTLNQLNVVPNKISEAESTVNSLYSLLSKTSTPMGKRLLKDRLLNPIVDTQTLNKRYSQIETFLSIYKDVEKYLNEISDIERFHRKISLLTLQPAEFSHLHGAYNSINNLLNLLNAINIETINNLILNKKSQDSFKSFRDEYLSIFNMEKIAKFNLNQLDESFFNVGVNKNIDDIDFEIKKNFKKLEFIGVTISNMIEKNSFYLKIDFNEKDGYHLSLTNSKFKLLNRDKLKEFTFKSLTNITKIKSEGITLISDKIISLKVKLSTILREEYLKYLEIFYQKYKFVMQKLVEFISTIDVIKASAKSASLYNYSKPTIKEAKECFFEAIDLRHPLIEQINYNSTYIPNSIFLGNKKYASSLGKNTISYSAKEKSESIDGLLVYGTNASGKSVLMKSVGLCVVMAQAGFFVPASSFIYSPFESLFTRISGDDDIFKGLSSFAIEMVELRDILTRANSKSLVLGDEISHGTETTSGQAIVASAIIQLAKRESIFIFATHLHQLSKMLKINSLSNIAHFHLKVLYDEPNKKLIYDRKLALGSGSAVYGLEVAKSLKLDKQFLNLAYQIRDEIMKEEDELHRLLKSPKTSRYNSKVLVTKCAICGEIAEEVHHIKPQSTTLINTHHKSNLVALCNKHHKMVHNKKLIIDGFIHTSNGIELNFKFITK